MNTLLRAMLPALLCSLAACATSDAADPTDDEQLRRLVGDAACSADDQCHTLAWGAKACGGPQRWVAWSSQGTDGPALQALAGKHAAAEREANVREHRVSTCNIVADQGARCVAQRCVLNNGAQNPVAK